MPLWHIHHPAGAYSEQQKRELAEDVTEFYARHGLPRFYVVTLFHEIPRASFLVGGEPSDDTVRIVVEHIARHAEDPGLRERMSEALSRLLAPHTLDRGLHCEFHVDETPRDLWMIDGLWPPPTGTEAERRWARENRPVPY
ncbi:tautomerase family protein [Nonomuraea roseoviolacea subsp. roseoviolacea]|uniref:Phenylpyruvate tautomerase PptA (4-oxalocrotonate tautomerase family) n=1 Tax=Nonomuraea roseoviolacea subsp. carminata TaxID=160689 RepID=A0ABT1K7Y8_9ACTN|nr:tautomerase family protein [Nonomuraea roseoviolacea]MCP2350115.1 phenylpyruvate tautomerase PptA (4-oxalocrotonate tautomerase family) [Nonomuraea roseoviolacea subsp. carminata]